MNSDRIVEEIQDINLSYLLLAQNLIKADIESALFRLKIKKPIAEVLRSLTAKQMTQLARTNQLLIRINLDNAEQLVQLTKEKRVQGLGQMHTALLASSTQV